MPQHQSAAPDADISLLDKVTSLLGKHARRIALRQERERVRAVRDYALTEL